MIFQVKHASNESRMLTVGPEPEKFSVLKKANSDTYRMFPAITVVKDEFCFAIGGKGKDMSTLGSVSRYNIDKDQWERGTPKLNVPRSFAAACSIGDNMYTFAGVDSDNKYLNSVEMMANVSTVATSGRKKKAWENIPAFGGVVLARADWELIKPPKEVFTPRRNPLVVPLNQNEIAILGGYGENGGLSDVLIFNVTSKECHKVADGGDYKFMSDNNQIALKGNKVIALVFDE